MAASSVSKDVPQMADKPVVHIGENSPEHVAYRLMQNVFEAEAPQKPSRQLILDTYAECLLAVLHPQGRRPGKDKTPEAHYR
jgi:hypothetical protein